MSRKRRPAEEVSHPDGAVRFLCPRGHRLGMAWLVDGGGYHLSRGRIEGDTVQFTCARCTDAGDRRDLQASWPKVRARLDDLQRDQFAGVGEYHIGGSKLY